MPALLSAATPKRGAKRTYFFFLAAFFLAGAFFFAATFFLAAGFFFVAFFAAAMSSLLMCPASSETLSSFIFDDKQSRANYYLSERRHNQVRYVIDLSYTI